MTTIELTDYEAETFLTFQKNKGLFDVLISERIHEMKNGNAILSFNESGILAKVQVEQVVYKVKK